MADDAGNDVSSAPPQAKKQRIGRGRNAALCKHFDTPQGCPFANCKFSHRRADDPENNEANLALAAQRQFIRDQVGRRTAARFEASSSGGGEDGEERVARRGTMIERYYTELFACDVMGKPEEDHYVHMHSNRLCVVGVAPSHPVMREEILEVVFTPHVLESRVTGKKKRGGQFILPHTILCNIKCASGKTYAIRGCMRGTLLEFNAGLLTTPKLLQDKHESDGYLVIIQPKTTEIVEIQESLLAKDEYKQYRAKAASMVADAVVCDPTP